VHILKDVQGASATLLACVVVLVATSCCSADEGQLGELQSLFCAVNWRDNIIDTTSSSKHYQKIFWIVYIGLLRHDLQQYRRVIRV
jgi:hypothetical protein